MSTVLNVHKLFVLCVLCRIWLTHCIDWTWRWRLAHVSPQQYCSGFLRFLSCILWADIFRVILKHQKV